MKMESRDVLGENFLVFWSKVIKMIDKNKGYLRRQDVENYLSLSLCLEIIDEKNSLFKSQKGEFFDEINLFVGEALPGVPSPEGDCCPSVFKMYFYDNDDYLSVQYFLLPKDVIQSLEGIGFMNTNINTYRNMSAYILENKKSQSLVVLFPRSNGKFEYIYSILIKHN